jgi:hypothetical protein
MCFFKTTSESETLRILTGLSIVNYLPATLDKVTEMHSTFPMVARELMV